MQRLLLCKGSALCIDVFASSAADCGIRQAYELSSIAAEELIFLPFPLFGAKQNICAVTS